MTKQEYYLKREDNLNSGLSPIEAIHREVYGKHLDLKIRRFDNPSILENYPSHNHNQIEALRFLLDKISDPSNTMSIVFGPMRMGKGVIAQKMHEYIGGHKAVALQHEIGALRFRTELSTRDSTGNLVPTGCSAKSFSSFEQLSNTTYSEKRKIFLIDEFQFLPSISDDQFSEWRDMLRSNNSQAIIFALDFDYRTLPWANTQLLIRHADSGALLAARCEKTQDKAWRTMRFDHYENGLIRPASFKGETIVSDDATNITSSYLPVSESFYLNAYSE